MIDWKRKLSSRKFQIAVTAFVEGLLIFLGYPENVVVQIGALILQGFAVIGYIIGEGLADAANSKPEE